MALYYNNMDNLVEQLHVIPVDSDLMELTARGTPDFPVAMYDNTFSEFLTGRVPWHWHAEVELIRLLSGEILLRCGERAETLVAGSGAFINANTLHAMTPVASAGPCRMISAAFSPELIAGIPNGACKRKFIDPLEQCKQLPCVTLAPDVGWQEETLGALDAAFAAYKNRAFAYELVVVEQLTGIWRRIVTKNRAELALTKPDAGDERIKQMLVFLQQNYTRRVTLKEIAASAHISERACTRCFQEKLRQSPFTYLNALRVRAAAEKLHSGDLPVSAIAEAVGFETGSYFSKVFRAAVGCSPRAYRSRLIAGETGAGRNPPGPSEEPGG